MIVNFKVCKYGTDSISIIGMELDDHQYCNNCTEDDFEYAYTETISVNLIVPVSSDETENWNKVTYEINEHTSEFDHSIVELNKDGLYKIIRLIIPTIQKGDYNGVIAEKINNDWVFKVNGVQEDIKDIVQNDEIDKFIDHQYTFFLQHLKTCYFDKVQNYLEEYCRNKCNLDIDTNIIWIGINVIQYLLDLGHIFEAQLILEKLQSCSGFCTTSHKSFNYACRCSR